MDYKGRIDADSILNSPWLAARVEVRTREIAAAARAFAPVDTGQLSASITSHIEKNTGVKRDRVTGVVSTNAHATDGSGYGSAEEFGTSDSRGVHFLRKAAGIA